MRITRTLLVATSLGMLASVGGVMAAPRTSADAAVEVDPTCPGGEDAASARARDAAEARNKPATTRATKPGTSRSSAASTSRGGGGEDTSATRTQGAKWHSFLPGMFR